MVYFGLRFAFRLAKPYLMRFLAKKMSEKFEKSFGGNPFEGFNQSQTSRQEGEVVIDKTPSRNSKTQKVVGEYIDFEEVE